MTQQWFFQFCRQVSRSLTAVTVITTIVTTARGVRRILVRGVNAPLPPDQPVITRITSPPAPIQKTALFACFRFIIFHPFFQGVSWPHLPLCSYDLTALYKSVYYYYVRTPMTITVQWSQKQLQEDTEIDKTQLKSKINTSKALCNTDSPGTATNYRLTHKIHLP